MKNRRARVDLIVDIIKNNCISSQEELGVILAKRGHAVTQATLSRDLKILKITKVPTDRGGYMYILPDSNLLKDKMLALGQTDLSEANQSGFISLEFSGNIAVIKTRTGYAAGIAYDIDVSNAPEILGTTAGTNTIIAILREDVSHEKARSIFARLLPLDKELPGI